jgi:(2Fe-2S) ferredoxin
MTPMEIYLKMQEEILEMKAAVAEDEVYVTVQLGICSQAAGAREVLAALEDAAAVNSLANVRISSTGCAGMCSCEPLVTMRKGFRKPVTYCNVTPEQARVILPEYALRNTIVEPWTLSGRSVVE